MGDIEAMFHQVRVPKEDCDCLRFLWWPSGDLSQKPVPYRMVVHLFGAVSSPSCANAALRQTAEANTAHCEPDVVQAVQRNFYVDDCLVSVDTEEKAIQLVRDISCLCSKGGFHLTKWSSNNHAVLESVPVEERAKGVKQLNLDHDDLPNERALGVHWYVEPDALGFKIVARDALPTRRNILSIVSSVYDPLGFVAPYVLTAKSLLQDLCRLKVDWDQQITGSNLQKWNQWLNDLPRLEDVKLQRCYKPACFSQISSCQLHNFSDASDTGYGMVSYIRFVDTEGRIHCSILMGKSRVTPLKKVTIPRMELTDATLSVRINQMIIRELDYHVDKVFYWTDSMSVLRYVNNEATRFHTFVANRVETIREASSPSQWGYVDTKTNPADHASRGLNVEKLLQNGNWMNGPDFLWKPEQEWPHSHMATETVPADDPELKRTVMVTLADQSEQIMDRLLRHFPSWTKLKKTVAWILVAINNLQNMVARRKEIQENVYRLESDPTKRQKLVDLEMKNTRNSRLIHAKKALPGAHVTAEMLQNAEGAIIRYVQRQHFSDEMQALQDGNRKLKRTSPVYKLDPFLEEGFLRVGGRLRRADIHYDAKHPIVLPKSSPVTHLLLQDTHNSVGHLGKNSMLTALREKFWILGAASLIKSLVSRCVICRKYQARRFEQKMADLPGDRLIPNEPPFSRVGVDYFGPFLVKRGRSVVKRYGVIFTCLAIRAVHLEVAHSLDTDSCINDIRRFVARRGPVKLIRSDNGTNLVGSERELREEINNWNQTKIRNTLSQKNIGWEFNPPAGSHFGGIWERMIRSVRKVLYSLLQYRFSFFYKISQSLSGR